MKKLLSLASVALTLASCVPSTPATRIQHEPAKFAQLSQKDQTLVQQGLIARGMSPAAVELAWGRPSQLLDGSKDGKLTMRWDYMGSRPVYGSDFYGGYGYGYGYGRYGPRRYSSLDYGFGPEVSYVPYRLATVQFMGDRVDSWERRR